MRGVQRKGWVADVGGGEKEAKGIGWESERAYEGD